MEARKLLPKKKAVRPNLVIELCYCIACKAFVISSGTHSQCERSVFRRSRILQHSYAANSFGWTRTANPNMERRKLEVAAEERAPWRTCTELLQADAAGFQLRNIQRPC